MDYGLKIHFFINITRISCLASIIQTCIALCQYAYGNYMHMRSYIVKHMFMVIRESSTKIEF